MRLVRLERQQSRVADDIRAALASLGRGSTVVGGIALIGVGTVTDRPVEAVVLLPHGVIIVIGVDLPDPALRLEAPLGAEWKADGWPLVADDDAINPATEALDLSQVCESRIAELVPGTAPVGTIVAVGPYVETVDQPASDLAGPVRVLHPTPTTMLAAAVSLATAHRPRSVDQVRALIRGLAPDAPDFSDEILLGEGFSRFSDDTPPESLWDTAPRSPGTLTTARPPAGWRTETPVTPTASGRTQLADPPAAVVEADHVLDHASSGVDHASSAPDHASSGLETAVVPPEATVAEPEPESSGPDLADVEPEQASAGPDFAVTEPEPASSAMDHASVESEPASSALDHARVEPDHASSALGHAPSPGLAAETDTASDPAAGEGLGVLGIPKSAEPSVPADSGPAKASATASESAILPGTTESAAETDTSASSPPARTLAGAQNKAAATSTATDPAPTQVSAMVSDTDAEPITSASAQAPAAAQYTVAAVGATKSAAEPSAANGSVLAQSSVAAQNTTVAPGAAQATGASTAPDAAQKVAATFADATDSTVSIPAPTAATISSGATRTGATKSAEPETSSDFTDFERTETLAKPPTALPVFPGADQIPPYRPAADTERTESLELPSSTSTETLPRPTAAPAESYPHSRPNPAPRQKPPAPTSRTVRWLPLGAIGLLVVLVVAAVVVATRGDDTAAAPVTSPPAPASRPVSQQPASVAPAQSLQFSLRAADGDQRCASHAFGDAQASLQQTSCSGVRRASYATTVDGRAGAVTVGIVAFPDAAQAAAFKAVADTPGGGGILDLAAETGKWGTPAPRFENAAYTSRLEGTSVRVVQAVWVPGPSTADDPGLVRAAKAALDLPAR
ncbi:hypothetical protein OG439_49820 [Amycolatopsis sp. NBC_01307]|uniref:hypothetical protein n=1 Tax=Amycolatopsis sp. NBC_01307 TaxID=2903561 RepID=UPI002E14BE7A|nr:hypothetical protein OG439_49820 [Amycolatopsis sp. NBC_01307]